MQLPHKVKEFGATPFALAYHRKCFTLCATQLGEGSGSKLVFKCLEHGVSRLVFCSNLLYRHFGPHFPKENSF